MSLPQDIRVIQEEIIEEFSLLPDWLDRYALIIEMGNELPDLPEQEKTPENLIDGCQSRVWISPHYDPQSGTLSFAASSDAVIVKGIIALLLRVLNHRTPQEIIDTDLSFIDAIGLREHLSHTRSNGLLAMIKRIKLIALSVQSQH